VAASLDATRLDDDGSQLMMDPALGELSTRAVWGERRVFGADGYGGAAAAAPPPAQPPQQQWRPGAWRPAGGACARHRKDARRRAGRPTDSLTEY
jgi:hypothetical protein